MFYNWYRIWRSRNQSWNCTHFRHPTDEQLRQLDIYRSRTSDRGLSSSNWTEWSAIWSEITTQSSIATLLDPLWNRPILGEKQWQQIFGNRSCKILHTKTFCLSFSWNFIDYFNQTLKSDCLFCFTVIFSMAEKKIQFRAKMVRFVNKSHHWGPIRLQG